ncbi:MULTISPECIES: hypothetical protein [Hyphobacterium]|uniref:Uncharacterized protein n=1 Tax=Hyphobacterium vulgare TaxID=1736751 RepID=A0ABV6ZU47_9PROT
MPLDLNAGTQTASGPSRFSALERTAQIARELAGRSGLTDLSAPASLDLRFADQFGYRKNAVTDGAETFEGRLDMLATISRSSLAYNPNWSFRSGDAVGRLEEVATNVLRYNAPPNTAGGRLVETSAATNKIRNPRGEGDDAALPSEYVSVPSGTTVTVIGRGVENGWPYLEVRWSGTPSGDPALYFEGSTQVPASTGQAWALAFGLKIVGGDLSNLTNIQARMLMRDSGGVYLGLAHSSSFTPDATHRRYFTAGTATHASLAYVQPSLYLDWDGSGAINITLRIYLPQLEQASAPTSPIMPPVDSPAESTCAAESVTEGVTFTRASRAYAMDWNGQSGGRVGPLKEFLQNTACQGEWGLWQTPFAVTNKIRNPRGVGASGSTAPTNWTNIGTGGLSRTYTRGTENGMDYVDIAFSGTQSSDSILALEQTTHIAALTGDKFTTSFGAKLIAGSYAGNIQIGHREVTSGAVLVVLRTSDPLVVDRQVRWFSFSDTLAGGGTTAYLTPTIYLKGYSGSVSFTLRVYIPQCTKTAFPCLPVLPEPGVVAESTQAAEVCEISNGGWSNDNGAGTLFADFISLGGVAGTFGRVLAYGSGASDYSAISLDQATSAIRVVGVDGAVTQWGLAGPSWVAGSRYRAAFSFASNDIHSAVNAVAADDTSATIGFGTSKLRIGEQVGALYPSPVPLLFKSIRYFPAALPDAEVDILGAAS